MEGIQASHGEERRQLEEVFHPSFLSVHHNLVSSQAVLKIRLTGDGKISWPKSESAEISEALRGQGGALQRRIFKVWPKKY